LTLIGRVERELRRKLKSGERLFFLLSDPEKPLNTRLVRKFEEAGADLLLVGGSLNVLPYDIDKYVKEVREADVKIPVVLFPGGLNNIAKSADAILFMSLLNTLDPYWLIGAQVAAAPLIKRLGLEVIPTGYLIIGHGGAAGHIGRSLPVPPETPYIVGAYAAASELLGLRALYLEAGSGAPRPVPGKAIEYARRSTTNTLLIVGGGLRQVDDAREALAHGADAIVVGTLAEKNPEKALTMLTLVKKK